MPLISTLKSLGCYVAVCLIIGAANLGSVCEREDYITFSTGVGMGWSKKKKTVLRSRVVVFFPQISLGCNLNCKYSPNKCESPTTIVQKIEGLLTVYHKKVK